MKPKFSEAESLINYLALHSQDSTDEIGLFHGQTGYVITLAEYARKFNKPQIETIADFICDNVFRKAGALRDISFATGLSGICWGIEYLVQKGILEGNAAAYCEEVDREIIKTDVSRLTDYSLKTGLGGLWHYVWARLQGNYLARLDAPFDDDYIAKWAGIIEANTDAFPPESIERLTAYRAGTLQPIKLSVSEFIGKYSEVPRRNLALTDGIAGYIIKKYLE